MAMTVNDLEPGWAWPANSRKAHYFITGEMRSMCMRWMYAGERSDTNDASPDNCAECRRKCAKRRARMRWQGKDI